MVNFNEQAMVEALNNSEEVTALLAALPEEEREKAREVFHTNAEAVAKIAWLRDWAGEHKTLQGKVLAVMLDVFVAAAGHNDEYEQLGTCASLIRFRQLAREEKSE